MPRVDVVIVGAGLGGLALAHHLAPHRHVLVVDQGTALGAEASSQNASMIRTLAEDPVERVLAVRSARWLQDPGEDWAEAPPARTTGAIVGLALDPHHLDDAVAHLRARGIPVDHPPAVPRWASADAWETAWWLPSAQIADPAIMMRGFAATLARHEGELRLRTTVVGFLGTDAITGVQTEQGPIEADAVVLAAGAFGQRLGALAGVHRPLLPLRRSIWRTAPHPLAEAHAPWVWLDDVGLYVRPDGDRFLVCGCDEQPEDVPHAPGTTADADPQMEQQTRKRLAHAFPALAEVPFETGWSGLRTFAPDRRPLLGPDPERPGLWWLAGLGGAGVTCAAAAGEAVAGWLLDRPVDWLPRRPVDPGRRPLRRFPIRLQGEWARPTLLDAREPLGRID
ncbi:MAG: FAD-dependent oxidoreductase [Myxococcota bacterium]